MAQGCAAQRQGGRRKGHRVALAGRCGRVGRMVNGAAAAAVRLRRPGAAGESKGTSRCPAACLESFGADDNAVEELAREAHAVRRRANEGPGGRGVATGQASGRGTPSLPPSGTSSKGEANPREKRHGQAARRRPETRGLSRGSPGRIGARRVSTAVVQRFCKPEWKARRRRRGPVSSYDQRFDACGLWPMPCGAVPWSRHRAVPG